MKVQPQRLLDLFIPFEVVDYRVGIKKVHQIPCSSFAEFFRAALIPVINSEADSFPSQEPDSSRRVSAGVEMHWVDLRRARSLFIRNRTC